MSNKAVFLIWLLVLSLILIGVLLLLGNAPQESPDPEEEEEVNGEAQYKDLIRLAHPLPNQTITSPLFISGEARGTWFFEADFPIRLLDANNNLLVAYFAQTPFDWMTEDYVTFSAHVDFSMPPAGTTGTLILSKDNPSDLSELDDEFRIPITFGELAQDTVEVQAHFSVFDPVNCETTIGVARRVPRTEAVGRAALNELLKGPRIWKARSFQFLVR
jgi:hypothetical protein